MCGRLVNQYGRQLDKSPLSNEGGTLIPQALYISWHFNFPTWISGNTACFLHCNNVLLTIQVNTSFSSAQIGISPMERKKKWSIHSNLTPCVILALATEAFLCRMLSKSFTAEAPGGIPNIWFEVIHMRCIAHFQWNGKLQSKASLRVWLTPDN